MKMNDHLAVKENAPTAKPQKFLHTICCNSCGTVLSKSYSGTESYVRCPKCQADLYYTVDDKGPTIHIIKKPKNLPTPPALAE